MCVVQGTHSSGARRYIVFDYPRSALGNLPDRSAAVRPRYLPDVGLHLTTICTNLLLIDTDSIYIELLSICPGLSIYIELSIYTGLSIYLELSICIELLVYTILMSIDCACTPQQLQHLHMTANAASTSIRTTSHTAIDTYLPLFLPIYTFVDLLAFDFLFPEGFNPQALPCVQILRSFSFTIRA